MQYSTAGKEMGGEDPNGPMDHKTQKKLSRGSTNKFFLRFHSFLLLNKIKKQEENFTSLCEQSEYVELKR
jgi:hypothetical protein